MFNESEPNSINLTQPSPQEYPDLNQISEEAYRFLFRQYSQIPNIESRLSEKWIGLKSLGLDDEQVERMCRPFEFNREQIMEQVGKELERDRRRWNRELKSQSS